MNKSQLHGILKRYVDASMRVDPEVLHYLEQNDVVKVTKEQRFTKFWNPRISSFEVKVYLEGRPDKRNLQMLSQDDKVELASRLHKKARTE